MRGVRNDEPEKDIPMTTHKLLLLPGDGIGPEVMAEGNRGGWTGGRADRLPFF